MGHYKSNGKLRVVLVIDDFEYGGAQRQVVELTNNLDSARFDVHICSLSNYVPLVSAVKERRRVHVIQKRLRWDATVVIRLAWLLRQLRADIVHGYLFSAEIASRLAGRLAGVPVVIGSQRTSRSELNRPGLLAYRATKRLANLIIANSKTGAEFHRRTHGYHPSQYRVIYNGVDTVRFAPRRGGEIRRELGIASGEKLVGVFASFKPKKNHQLFFKAASKVLRRVPSTRLLLVGEQLYGHTDAYKRRIDELIDGLGVRDKCIFLGNRDDVGELYSACDLTVLPSLTEGTPNVLLESMACGVPVVATDVSDNAYIVPDGRVGYLVPATDPDAMAAKISLLLEDDAGRREMARRARKWVTREFPVSRLAVRTEQVYLECVDRRRD
jgi:glycosyltransferase involved in cell wall biosynthesis